jgi:hypothetical protein
LALLLLKIEEKWAPKKVNQFGSNSAFKVVTAKNEATIDIVKLISNKNKIMVTVHIV